MLLIGYAQLPLIDAHVDVSSQARGLKAGLMRKVPNSCALVHMEETVGGETKSSRTVLNTEHVARRITHLNRTKNIRRQRAAFPNDFGKVPNLNSAI